MPTPFEDFVVLELPKRPTMLTTANTGFDGDPNTGGPPSVVSGAPQGSFYLRATGSVFYKKNTSSAGTWEIVGTGVGTPTGTTAPLTWHVETTGNDATGDGSVGAPFATTTGALAKLRSTYGERIRHLVEVVMGVGNFPGFNVQGWEMDPMDNTLPCGLRFVGTFIAPTLSGGTASGTFTSVAPGNLVADVVSAVLSDSVQAWVPGALKGLLIEVLTGTSTGTILPIHDNTATSVTVTTSGAVGSVGGTYALRDFGTVITSTVPFAPAIPAFGAAPATPAQAGINVFNSEVAPTTAEIRIEQIKIAPTSSPTTAQGINIQGEACTVQRCFIGGPHSGTRIQVNGGLGTILLSGNIVVVSPTLFSRAFTLQGVGNTTISGNYITAGTPTGSAIGGVGVQVLASTLLNTLIIGNKFDAMQFGIFASGQAVMILSGNHLTGGGSQIIRVDGTNSGNSNATGGLTQIVAGSLSLNGASGSTALSLEGPMMANIVSLFGSGNLTGINLIQGARLKVGPLSTITGTTEISVDGVATTLATMRATSPKVLTNSYGTTIWE